MKKYVVTVALEPNGVTSDLQADVCLAIIGSGIKFQSPTTRIQLSASENESAGVALFTFYSNENKKTVERKLSAWLRNFGLLCTTP